MITTTRQLWPTQERGIAGVAQARAEGHRRILMTAPTGAGKSIMICEIIAREVEAGGRAVLYTMRKMLREQLSRTLEQHGIEHGIRASGEEENMDRPVQVSSMQTEHSRVYRQKRWDLHRASLVVIDEAHLQKAALARRIMDDHSDHGAVIVGVTATPLDMDGLYTVLVQAGTTSELREIGALVRADHYGPDEPDKDMIGKTPTGEYEIDGKVRQIWTHIVFGRVLTEFFRLNPEQKPTILFAPGVAESLWFAEQFACPKKRDESLRHFPAVPAAHIDGSECWLHGEYHRSSREKRDEILAGVRDNSIKIVCNRFVLREGIDIPELEHGILATVFGSLQSYLQSGGRLLRACPKTGKKRCVIQDHGGCLDTETEILTRRGWLGCDEVSDEDTIGTMSLESGAFEWCQNEGTIRKTRDSFMKQAVCPHINIRVTDYHEMVMRSDARGGAWKKIKAGELSLRKSNWIIPTSAIEDVAPCNLSDAEIGFIGWFITDGCLDSARIRIYQSGYAPAKHHAHIVSCLEGCGFRYSRRERLRTSPFSGDPSREVIYSISSGRKSEGGWDRLTPWIDKSFPMEVFEKLDRRQFGVLLHAMNLGDGLKRQAQNQKTISLAVAKKDVADRIQSLAVRRGYRCNIARENHKSGCVIFILHIRDSQVATVAKGEFTDSYIGLDERVWCVQTSNGTIITRRHGKVAIMGNSWWRHGSLNADRVWSIGDTARVTNGLREDRMREKKEKEPIVCPNCFACRMSGPRCWKCGFEHHQKSRLVIQSDGTLRERTGDIYRPHTTRMKNNTLDLWKQMFYRARMKGRTFKQAEALFFIENHYYPPRDLPLMPINDVDWYRPVNAVPMDRLT